ncbi:MAG: hypothetical protein LUH05_01990 [Candidatus Gastranaerophilales bacterium]|nr:hypothetical protein [Candidatus Gastranaerophilales bacterium]
MLFIVGLFPGEPPEKLEILRQNNINNIYQIDDFVYIASKSELKGFENKTISFNL